MKINIGENIKTLRTAKNLTQEKLADFLGVSFQAISKWERGETVPDIYMIPAIADFFNVSTDFLLGHDEEEKKKDVEEYISEYYRLWNESKFEELLVLLKSAVKKYPSEFSITVRYLNTVVWCGRSSPERAISVKNEAEGLYDRINEFCTIDSIRIWAKKIMCDFYLYLTKIENSGVTEDDIEKLLSDMPLMQNCRDYLSGRYNSDAHIKTKKYKATIFELAHLLSKKMLDLCIDDTELTNNDKKEVLTSLIKSIEALFPNGDYGKAIINISAAKDLIKTIE